MLSVAGLGVAYYGLFISEMGRPLHSSGLRPVVADAAGRGRSDVIVAPSPQSGDGGHAMSKERSTLSVVAGANAMRADGSLVPRKVLTRSVTVAPEKNVTDPIGSLLAKPLLLKEPKLVARPFPKRPEKSSGNQKYPIGTVASPVVPPAGIVETPQSANTPVEAKQSLAVTTSGSAALDKPAGLGIPEAGNRTDVPPVEALEQRVSQLGATGRLDPASLSRRLAELKVDRSFDHARTRFPLTGKHKRVACESCHKATLKDTPRQCIDCHRNDDAHRGRRPKCEQCHVTSGWSTIRRRR